MKPVFNKCKYATKRVLAIFKNRLFYALCFLFLSISSFAQPNSLTNSIKKTLKNKPTLVGGFHSRGAFIDGNPASFYSLGIGLNYSNKLTITANYHWLKRNSKFSTFDLFPSNEYVLDLKMRYISLGLAYTFYEKKNWLVSIPIKFGVGNSFYKDSDKNSFNKQTVLLYEPVMLVEYRVLNYFGVAGGIGFRLMLLNNKQIDKQFHSPVYVARLRIYYSKIYNDFFK